MINGSMKFGSPGVIAHDLLVSANGMSRNDIPGISCGRPQPRIVNCRATSRLRHLP